MKKEFAVYKGDKYVTSGTIYELSKELGVKLETIQFYNTQSYKKRIKERDRLAKLKGKRCKAIVLVSLDEE